MRNITYRLHDFFSSRASDLHQEHGEDDRKREGKQRRIQTEQKCVFDQAPKKDGVKKAVKCLNPTHGPSRKPFPGI